MGGHAAGELASPLTIESIVDETQGSGIHEPSATRGYSEHLRLAFATANERACRQGRIDKRREGMGSTAIAGWVEGDALHLCHAMAEVEPEVTDLLIRPADRVLLCSGWPVGSGGGVRDQGITTAEGSMLELASALIDRGNAAGGQDNITVVLYERQRLNRA